MPKRTKIKPTPLPTLQESRFLEGTTPSSSSTAPQSPPPSPTRAINKLQQTLQQCREQLYNLLVERKKASLDPFSSLESYDVRLQQIKLKMIALINDRRELEQDLSHVGLGHLDVFQTGNDISRDIQASIIRDSKIEVRSDIPIRRVGSSQTRWSLCSSIQSSKEDLRRLEMSDASIIDESNFEPFEILTPLDPDFDRQNGLLSSSSDSDDTSSSEEGADADADDDYDDDNVFDADIEELSRVNKKDQKVLSIPVRHVSFRSLRLQRQKQLQEQKREERPLPTPPVPEKDWPSPQTKMSPIKEENAEKERKRILTSLIPKTVKSSMKTTTATTKGTTSKLKPFHDKNQESPIPPPKKNVENRIPSTPRSVKSNKQQNNILSSTPLAVKSNNINSKNVSTPLGMNISVEKPSSTTARAENSSKSTPLSMKDNNTAMTNMSTANANKTKTGRPSLVRMALMKEASLLATKNTPKKHVVPSNNIPTSVPSPLRV